jgi:FtsZ-binding cell division protein ZapB
VNIIWFERDDLIPNVIKQLNDADIVLDIGCGIMPQPYITPKVHLCCEPFDQYIKVLQKRICEETDKNYILLKLTWEDVIKIFPPQSVDTIFLVDVVEHVEKEKGLQLLRETEKIAGKQIVIFTPLGFMAQEHLDGKDAWNMNGGAWQEHKSGWLPEDFDNNWTIYACEDYHRFDSKGNHFDEPFGAFWAIRKAIKQDENTTNSDQDIPKSLWLNFQSLQQEYQSLQQEYQSLQQEYQSLQQEYQSLQQEYQSLQQSMLVKLAIKFGLLRG